MSHGRCAPLDNHRPRGIIAGGVWYDGAPCLEGTSYARQGYAAVNHFNDFPSALVTCAPRRISRRITRRISRRLCPQMLGAALPQQLSDLHGRRVRMRRRHRHLALLRIFLRGTYLPRPQPTHIARPRDRDHRRRDPLRKSPRYIAEMCAEIYCRDAPQGSIRSTMRVQAAASPPAPPMAVTRGGSDRRWRRRDRRSPRRIRRRILRRIRPRMPRRRRRLHRRALRGFALRGTRAESRSPGRRRGLGEHMPRIARRRAPASLKVRGPTRRGGTSTTYLGDISRRPTVTRRSSVGSALVGPSGAKLADGQTGACRLRTTAARCCSGR